MQSSNAKKVLIPVAILVAIAIIVIATKAMTKKNVSGPETGTATANVSGPSTSSAVYKNGDYTATASYNTPETIEDITLAITLKDNVVTGTAITSTPKAPQTHEFQGQFVANYKQLIVGKAIDAIHLSRVSGSSLTSGGFNAALEKIKTQARM